MPKTESLNIMIDGEIVECHNCFLDARRGEVMVEIINHLGGYLTHGIGAMQVRCRVSCACVIFKILTRKKKPLVS